VGARGVVSEEGRGGDKEKNAGDCQPAQGDRALVAVRQPPRGRPGDHDQRQQPGRVIGLDRDTGGNAGASEEQRATAIGGRHKEPQRHHGQRPRLHVVEAGSAVVQVPVKWNGEQQQEDGGADAEESSYEQVGGEQ